MRDLRDRTGREAAWMTDGWCPFSEGEGNPTDTGGVTVSRGSLRGGQQRAADRLTHPDTGPGDREPACGNWDSSMVAPVRDSDHSVGSIPLLPTVPPWNRTNRQTVQGDSGLDPPSLPLPLWRRTYKQRSRKPEPSYLCAQCVSGAFGVCLHMQTCAHTCACV